MLAFSDLPDEILLLTANCGILRPADLAAVARSCKRLKGVTEDALYAQNRDRDGSSAVDWAAKHGSIATLDKALTHGLSIEPNGWDHSSFEPKFNPFQTAVEHGQDSAVTWFLDHGADVSRRVRPRCRCQINETCILHAAMCSRNASTTLLLISRGAPLKYYSERRGDLDDRIVAAFLEASLFGLDTVVEVLVKDHGNHAQLQEALIWAAVDDRNVSMIRTLVGLGADVNRSHTDWNRSPLHSALVHGSFTIAHTLLDLGANIHLYHIAPDNQYQEDEDEMGNMELQAPENSLSPLHDTIAAVTHGCSPTFHQYRHRLGQKASYEEWQIQKSLFMKRLIELGVDVNMRALSRRPVRPRQYRTPLDLAIEWEDVHDVAMLLAAGAKVDSNTLHIAWETHSYDEDKMRNCMKMIRLLLKYGARLDGPPTPSGMSLLQVIADGAETRRGNSGLHEILLLSSPKNLSREHLSDLLEDYLMCLNWYTSTLLVRHGARVSDKDVLFFIASAITDELEVCRQVRDDAPMTLYGQTKLRGCVELILDMGLSGEDQCLIFYDALRKRQIDLAHLFLDRGIASKAEATKYLPAFLMLAASWGNAEVIDRLWQHAHEALDPTLRLLLVFNSIIRDRKEAVSFFMDHGATPFDSLLPAQIPEELLSIHDTVAARHSELASSEALEGHREFRRTQLHAARWGLIENTPTPLCPYETPLQLAVGYGRMDIIGELLEHIPQDADATATLRNVHIPPALTQANQIRDMIEKAGNRASWSSQLRAK